MGIGGMVAVVSERGMGFLGGAEPQQVGGDPGGFSNPGSVGGNHNDHPIGVWYSNANLRWAVFNQDFEEMSEGSVFDVYIPPPSEGVFVHRAVIGNTSGDSTYIDNPSTNGDPNATLSVTQNWNPEGIGGIYNDHPIDVRYAAGTQRWVIFNQDGEEMPDGAAFNVNALPQGEPTFVHRATTENIPADVYRDVTYIDSPLTNENPGAIIFVDRR